MNDAGIYGISQRQPPSNMQAEMSLLGALLSNNRAYERVVDFLEPRHFADPTNGRLFQLIGERILDGRTVDAVTLKADLEHSGVLDEVGGTAYIAELITSMVGVSIAGEYGAAIRDAWLKRQLVEVGQQIANEAFGLMSGEKQVEAAERALSELGGGAARRDRVVNLGDAVHAAVAQAEAIHRGGPSPAVMTGIAAVDEAIGGLWPGNYILFGGIPGSGKTSLAVQIAVSLAQRLHDAAIRAGASLIEAKRQPGVAIFSLEMSAEEIGQRVAAFRAGVSVTDLLRGKLDATVAVELARAERETAHLPVRIHDCRAISVKLLGAKIRMHLQRQPELLIVVDHLLVLDTEAADGKRSSGNDAANVSKAARDLKQLARDTNLPFLVLTHATRASQARTNPRPVLTDCKYAGEGDADTLFFVHRPVMFFDSEPPPRGAKEGKDAYGERRSRWLDDRERLADLAELVVVKRRMGPTSVKHIRWHGPTTSFHNWDGNTDENA